MREAQHWEAGQKFAFIPKGSGMLLVPVTKPEELTGMLKGASTSNYRDRNDRY